MRLLQASPCLFPPAARSILINAGCQVVIFLYLLDSETSMVVLLSAGMGTAIEFWKVLPNSRALPRCVPGPLCICAVGR